ECLKSLRILLVLDNCEHVIDAVALLAETSFRETAGVHILATSREALRVEGEHAYWLPPLASPPPGSNLGAAEVLTFPAVRLFMERAAAGGARFELTDRTAPIVAGICGRLDGLALAIEFAAGRVGSHGIAGTEELLNKSLGLDWHGRRTAVPRHQTLRALLDWSYSFLAESEQLLLRRLAIFVGAFSLEAAQAVTRGGALSGTRVLSTIDSLVAKSLVRAVIQGSTTRYRLLETTRVYAAEKLEESGEALEIAERHARYFIGFRLSGETGSAAAHLGNIRAALAWCFAGGPRGATTKVALGIELAAAATPLFLELSLLDECHKWSTVALASIDAATRGTMSELVLQEAFAIAAAWARGNGDEVRTALTRGLDLAAELGEGACRLRLLVGMHVFLLRSGDFRGSLGVAEELQTAAQNAADLSYLMLSDWLRGSSEHFTGNQAAAREFFERGFARTGPRSMQLFGLDYRVRALVTFARVLWLSGFPDRAREMAREAIGEAAQGGKPLNVCFALLYTASVFLWCGDLDGAREGLEKLMAHPNWRALPSLHATCLGLKGELLIRLGDFAGGVAMLRDALGAMRTERQSILVARAAYVLAEALAARGEFAEAQTHIDDAISKAMDNGEGLELPELLRVKGAILLSMPEPAASEAEEYLLRSLECARRQSARSWEVRAATTLARIPNRPGD
ncbi:MAG TPA: hypothetical protein VGC34_10465, partial [Steroidobacteraceae bacterium]